MPVTTFVYLLLAVLFLAAATLLLAFWAQWPLAVLSILALSAALILRGAHVSR